MHRGDMTISVEGRDTVVRRTWFVEERTFPTRDELAALVRNGLRDDRREGKHRALWQIAQTLGYETPEQIAAWCGRPIRPPDE